MSVEDFTLFLGWVTAANIGLFVIMVAVMASHKDKIAALHGKLFGLKKEDLFKAYFEYMGRYKMMILFFNLVPYLVLRLVILA